MLSVRRKYYTSQKFYFRRGFTVIGEEDGRVKYCDCILE